MGLTISYILSIQHQLDDMAVRQLVERTAEFARRIGCEEVHGPHEGGPELCKLRRLPNDDTTGDFIAPESGWSVKVLPGEGCETANFGLCRYPDVEHWKLTSWCKTQYAARHGMDHFLTCHRRIISLLDLWRDFGVELEVCDEGEYWQTRSLENLRRRIAMYDRLVAAVAGTFKDAADEHGPRVRAEIFDDARFERLEAEGRAEFAAKLEELRQLFGK